MYVFYFILFILFILFLLFINAHIVRRLQDVDKIT